MANTNRIHDIEKALYKGKINTPFAAVPFTEIKNEQGQSRKIADLTQNLKAHQGVERVMFKNIKKVNEVGPSGKLVWELGNDERCRLVGVGQVYQNDNSGIFVFNGDAAGFYEFTFYGTGINLLLKSDNFTRDFQVSIDGGSETLIAPPVSSVLQSRGYAPNQVVSLYKGQSLGWHTVKVRQDGGDSPHIHGVEFINENAQVVVNSGQPFQGGFAAKLATQALLDTKPSDLTGTKGGRVVTYIDESGNLGQAVTVVDPAVTEGDPTELVTNGTFDTDTDWTKTGSSTISGGEATTPNSSSGVEQTITTTIGQKYTINYEITATVNNGGIIQVDGNNVTGDVFEGIASVTFTATLTSTVITLRGSGGSSSATWDNISVKEIAYNFLALDDTDHSEEEVYRTINFREFGASRGDDFDTLNTSISNRAFTLDDGTTTLVGNIRTNGTGDKLEFQANGTFVTITFVGTGLDIFGGPSAPTGSGDDYEAFVDGVNIGNFANDADDGRQLRRTICSSLPYGTHTVKLIRNSATQYGYFIKDFIVYQPKKPTLPEDVIELADYNVMADYVFNSGTLPESNSDGIIIKDCVRETIYSNSSWTILQNSFDVRRGGANAETSDNGAYFEYTFFGTGIGYSFGSFNSHTTNSSMTIDGVLVTDANFGAANIDFKGSGASSFNGTTGQLNQNSGLPNGAAMLSVKNLSLGIHTVRVTNNVAGTITHNGWDVITPIHTPDTQVGSLGLKDLRQNAQIEGEASNKVDWGKAKALLVYDVTNKSIIMSYNIATVVFASTSNIRIWYKRPFKEVPVITHHGRNNLDRYVQGIDGAAWETGSSKIGARLITSGNDFVKIVALFGELENEADINLEDL